MKLLFILLLISTGTFNYCFGQFNFNYSDSIIVKEGTTPLVMPWAGGLNYSQFSDFDYDFDGDLDLFVFDRSQNNIRVFTQEDEGNGPYYKLAYNSKSKFPTDVLYRATLVDYDADGRKDLFTFGVGGIKVYRNIGDAVNGLQWELYQNLVYSEYPGGNFNLFVSGSDIPAIVDVDDDGDIDILTFHQGGYHVEYHQNQSMELYGIPDSLVYIQMNQCWGKFVEDPLGNNIFLDDQNYPCLGGDIPNPESDTLNSPYLKMHSGSSLLALDYNNSGVMDLIIGDASYPNLSLLINGGVTVNSDSPMISVDYLFPSNSTPVNLNEFPAGFYVDVDFDGIKDLIVCPNAVLVSVNQNSIHFYKNTGTNTNPNFVFSTNSFLQNEMIEYGTGSIPTLVDYDEDGLEDLMVGNYFHYVSPSIKKSAIAYYKNTGTLASPEFTFISDDIFDLEFESYGLRTVPTFGDIDDDGDQDMFIGLEDGTIVYYENESVGSGAVFGGIVQLNYADNSGNPMISSGFAYPQLFDLNDDGLLDLIIGTKTGEIMYYQNDGTINTPLFELYNPTLGGVDIPSNGPDGYAAPHFFRENGETHLFLGSVLGKLIYYEGIDNNISAGQLFALNSSSYLNIDVEAHSSFCVNNIDNDGDLNMFVGQDLGGLFHFETDTTNSNALTDLVMDPIVSIYPNPTKNSITISSEQKMDRYTIINIHGEVLFINEINSDEFNIDLSSIPNGLYFLQVDFKNGKLVTKKLIKQ
ncbi:MAG: T9SS type A sorting domain-containing protein [Crocinitomicaceae bacterium]|nr:T9SS type A sorting domain-containing protein [Crocinitomicaceae bacterium]